MILYKITERIIHSQPEEDHYHVMNILLTIGLILIIGYLAGWICNQLQLPKIIGYIATGIAFSPNTIDLIDYDIIPSTVPLLKVCMAFIAFEVGGALKWTKIKAHKKEIISITLFASFLPFLFIAAGVFILGICIPVLLPLDSLTLLLLALLLGALASPTAPAATLAIIHQYKAKGKVTDTILGVSALDDVLGILLFSLTIAVTFIFTGDYVGLIANPLVNSLYEVLVAITIGIALGAIISPMAKLLNLEGEGQWVVIIFSLIILCTGISEILKADVLLSAMTMGMIVVNRCKEQKIIFKILERYTEDLIFLFFFLLIGLQLDIATLPHASILVVIFVGLRILGKIMGANIGAKLINADRSIQKYTAGGLLPQAGIVIGLVLKYLSKERIYGNI